MERQTALQRLAISIEELLDNSIEDVRARQRFERAIHQKLDDFIEHVNSRFDRIREGTGQHKLLTGLEPIPSVKPEHLTQLVSILKWLPTAAAVIYETFHIWFNKHP